MDKIAVSSKLKFFKVKDWALFICLGILCSAKIEVEKKNQNE